MTEDEELDHLRQENQAIQTANQTLREGLLEAIHAIESWQKQVKDLEGVISDLRSPRTDQNPGGPIDQRQSQQQSPCAPVGCVL
jgi:uncharacterized protein (DUF3084 family)